MCCHIERYSISQTSVEKEVNKNCVQGFSDKHFIEIREKRVWTGNEPWHIKFISFACEGSLLRLHVHPAKISNFQRRKPEASPSSAFELPPKNPIESAHFSFKKKQRTVRLSVHGELPT